MSLKVVENFLSSQNYNALYSAFTSEYFPWYYNNYKRDEDNNKLFHYQLTHVFFKHNKINSTYFTILESLLKKLKLKALKKVKANLNPINDKLVEFGEHKDAAKESQYMSMIYYLNTNNGYTLFENGEKVGSVENQLITFDGLLKHCSVAQTDENLRVNINIDLS